MNNAKLIGGRRIRQAGGYSSDMPLFSIITVVYNGVAHLEKTILSVLNQTYLNIEYIIIDGGSTDGTLDVIRRYDSQINYWVSEPDRGIYDAMNKGIVLATGEVIGLLNAGDVYFEGSIANLASNINQKSSIYYGDFYIYYPDLNIQRLVIANMYGLRYHMSICHQALFVSRTIYAQYGLYNLDYQLAADYDLISTCYRNHVTFQKLNMPVVCFFNGGASDQNAILYKRECLQIAFKRHIPMSDLFKMLKKSFIEILLNKTYWAIQQMIGTKKAATLRQKWQNG